MKRKDLIRQLETDGCVLVRHGGKHDWYHNPVTKVSQPVPRHIEINEPVGSASIGQCLFVDATSFPSVFPKIVRGGQVLSLLRALIEHRP